MPRTSTFGTNALGTHAPGTSALALVALLLAACGGGGGEAAAGHAEPAHLVLDETAAFERYRVVLTAHAAERLDIQTAPVAAGGGGGRVVPYAALIYDEHGEVWTYTNPEPLTFVRERVAVTRIDGPRALVSRGPAVGTAVVTVGTAELYGTEFGVGH